MLFHTPVFILGFLPLCLGGFFLLGRLAPALALRWLLAMSLGFYGWWHPPLVGLLLASILGNWAIGHAMGRAAAPARARWWLRAGIAANLALLGWFKYASFVCGVVAPGIPAPEITLPLAISFFTFQQIMMLVDQYRDRAPPTRLCEHAVFVAFFPHLIAGPLVRPAEILPQLRDPAFTSPNRDNLVQGLTIFLLGLGKKLVLADPFGHFADIGFNAAARGESLTLLEAWCALLAYALQIYFDFSGYSDMAIGLARMLNIRFPANFDSPYQAETIADFWRRWHITLGAFLRDYVYIPLGGSRHGLARHVAALMVTMTLCGLWHGAGWRFIVWGAAHGLLLVGHALWRLTGMRLPNPLAWALTLLAVILAWVPFRAADLPTAWAFLRALAGEHGLALPAMITHAVPALAWIATPVPLLPHLGDARTLSLPEVTVCLVLGWFIALALPNTARWSERGRQRGLVAGFALTAQAVFFAPNVAPFLYFQF
jgi:D-alanyl-lipoteichoic acid acyltransferase DltB (MBOAT superfamily)